MEMLKIGVDLGAVFQMNEVCEGTYVKGVLFSFLQQLMKFNHQIVEIFIFSADNPSISPMVFDSFSVHQLNIDQVIFTGGESLISYLQALEVEVYFSADEFVVAKAQAVGILAGVISNQVPLSTLSIAFDHRLFLDQVTYSGLGKWIPLLGYIQQQDKQSLSIELMTTRSYSVDRWIKELFKDSQCKINAVCFIASGKGADLMELYNVHIYFEGEQREQLSPLPNSECILNIDF